MRLILDIAIVINILTFIIFLGGFLFFLKRDVLPKRKAFLGVVMAIAMLLYFLAIICVTIQECLNYNFLSLLLLLFLIFPFIIGYIAKYETYKKYTIIQILLFFASCYILFLLKI